MKPELARLKIAAYLHDAPDKALLVRGHAVRGRLLQGLLLGGGGPGEDPRLERADRWAAAADRVDLPRERWDFFVDFQARPTLIHPLAGTRYDLEPLRLRAARVAADVRRVVRRMLRVLPLGEDPVRRYWALYRVLPELLQRGRTRRRPRRLGSLWGLLPADTRIPDHSLWDHARLSSALAAALPRPALLLFSLGPVQPFIATARRTADLWAGSYLLSFLLWRALEPIVESWGGDAVLFPALTGQPFLDEWLVASGKLPPDWRERLALPTSSAELRVASLPNRFLALLPEADAPVLAAAAAAAARRAFQEEVVAEARRHFEDGASLHAGVADLEAVVRRQTEGFPRCQWYVLPWLDEAALARFCQEPHGAGLRPVWEDLQEARRQATPLPSNPGALYPVLHRLAEMGHAAVKAVRPFGAREEPGLKCSLCGRRQAVWEARTPGLLREDERLCGLCAVKRAFPRTRLAPGGAAGGGSLRFPSTHALAQVGFWRRVVRALKCGHPPVVVDQARALLEAAREAEPAREVLSGWTVPRLAAAWKEVPRDLQPLRELAADWLLAGTLEGEALRELAAESGAPLAFVRLFAARARAFLAAVATHLGVAPGRYYAVVHADGDRLGAWLAGGEPAARPTLEEALHPALVEAVARSGDGGWLRAPRPLTPARHGAISRALGNHALRVVPPVVRTYYGQLVYAGGDDLLAFLPLEDLLPAVADLRDVYAGRQPGKGSRLGGALESGRGFVRLGQALYATMGERATLSAGVVVAHAMAPLARVLEAVREAEGEAKRRGRDRLQLRVLRRSGSEEAVTLPWRTEGFRPLELLERLRGWLAEGKVSRRFVYELREVLPALAATPLLPAEAARLLARHVLLRGDARAAFLRREEVRAFGPDLDRLVRVLGDAEEGGRALAAAEFLSRGGGEG